MLRRSTTWLAAFWSCSLWLAACDSDLDVRLAAALQGSADSVTITDTHVVAACKGGGEGKVLVDELALDVFGMADIEKQTAVAQRLQQQCDSLVQKRTQEAQAKSALHEAAKKLGVATDGKDEVALRDEICVALTKQLPQRGEQRAEKAAQHTRDFGCPDPGEPELGPGRLWQVEDKGKGKKRTVFLRLDSAAADGSDDEGRSDQLTIKCAGRERVDAYIATTTKLNKAPLVVQVDGKKGRFKTRLSKSKKAVFLKDAKKGVKTLLGKDELVVTLPAKGKPRRTFPIDGVEAALAPYAKLCGI